MKKTVLAIATILAFAPGFKAQTAPDAAELTRLVKEFLDGASRNDAAVHDRFWADDLIYTGSSGRRIGKSDIMRDQRSPRAAVPADSSTTYFAEDIRIQQYDSTAIVAFRLVAVSKREGKSETSNYLNTGTFLKRNGRWRVVSWQATRMPRSEEEAKKSVAASEAAFHQAILTANTKALERLIDGSFSWTQRNGDQIKLQRLIEDLRSGRLKYTKIDTSDVTASVYGDAAVVHGVARIQRASIPGANGGDGAVLVEHYTMMLANRDGSWKIVAMHTSGS
jgi:Domain of unknown function (DUF4440)